MKTSRFTWTRIVLIVDQSDAGVPACYKWKSKHGGLEAPDLRRAKGLAAENAKLKRIRASSRGQRGVKDLITTCRA